MDSLHDLLSAYSPKEPPEVIAIKQYIQKKFDAASSVGLTDKAIIITVASGSLANSLRMHVPKLKAAAKTSKSIIFRIG